MPLPSGRHLRSRPCRSASTSRSSVGPRARRPSPAPPQAAEALGFADVWVSDHIAIPAAQDYPSPYLYDPLLTLTWAAAATDRVGLGTSVLVVPQHNALALANSLASLDALSGGRLTVGAGVGWSAAEFAALGQSFTDRGKRFDEMIDVLRGVLGNRSGRLRR